MTRILQIRRGTAAQNGNFTGLSGEITMDADAKTLRVHDGETLGGHELARADLSNVAPVMLSGGGQAAEAFDISSVSGEFWEALFREHNIRSECFALSDACNIGNVPVIEYIFDAHTPVDPAKAVADCVLSCHNPEAGYGVGDIAHAFGIGSRAAPRPVVFQDANGLRLRLPANSEAFWVSNKSTGAPANITNANWRIIFRIWY